MRAIDGDKLVEYLREMIRTHTVHDSDVFAEAVVEINEGRFDLVQSPVEERDAYVKQLEDHLIDVAHLCYAPPEHFEINGGSGKGVCGTCDLGQDGSKVHDESCGLQFGWNLWKKREAQADKEGK